MARRENIFCRNCSIYIIFIKFKINAIHASNSIFELKVISYIVFCYSPLITELYYINKHFSTYLQLYFVCLTPWQLYTSRFNHVSHANTCGKNFECSKNVLFNRYTCSFIVFNRQKLFTRILHAPYLSGSQ